MAPTRSGSGRLADPPDPEHEVARNTTASTVAMTRTGFQVIEGSPPAGWPRHASPRERSNGPTPSAASPTAGRHRDPRAPTPDRRKEHAPARTGWPSRPRPPPLPAAPAGRTAPPGTAPPPRPRRAG